MLGIREIQIKAEWIIILMTLESFLMSRIIKIL